MHHVLIPPSTVDIVKRYHFHAAHRNRELHNKCSNIHGHTYHLTCTFRMLPGSINPQTGVTIEFAEIDERVNVILSSYDHALLLQNDDPLLAHLKTFPEDLKIKQFPCPTSAENVAIELLNECIARGLPVCSIELFETTSSGVTVTSPLFVQPPSQKPA